MRWNRWLAIFLLLYEILSMFHKVCYIGKWSHTCASAENNIQNVCLIYIIIIFYFRDIVRSASPRFVDFVCTEGDIKIIFRVHGSGLTFATNSKKYGRTYRHPAHHEWHRHESEGKGEQYIKCIDRCVMLDHFHNLQMHFTRLWYAECAQHSEMIPLFLRLYRFQKRRHDNVTD